MTMTTTRHTHRTLLNLSEHPVLRYYLLDHSPAFTYPHEPKSESLLCLAEPPAASLCKSFALLFLEVILLGPSGEPGGDNETPEEIDASFLASFGGRLGLFAGRRSWW